MTAIICLNFDVLLYSFQEIFPINLAGHHALQLRTSKLLQEPFPFCFQPSVVIRSYFFSNSIHIFIYGKLKKKKNALQVYDNHNIVIITRDYTIFQVFFARHNYILTVSNENRFVRRAR